MTREEVKAQLAKCPLEWEKEQSGAISAELPKLTRWLGVRCSISYGELSVEMYSDEDCFTDYIASSFYDTELKAKAEDHRLDLICRLLGIND